MLTSAQVQLQNIEKVSSGLSVISQRLRGVAEVGEDGAQSIASLQEEFSKIDVDIINKQTGELNSTFDILSQMAEIYPKLNSAQKSFYTELAAGFRTIVFSQNI